MNDVFEKMRQLKDALQVGLDKTVATFPIIVRQQIEQKAKRKLKTSLHEYLDNVNVGYDGMVLIIDINRDSWLANAVELGVSAFDIKKGMFESPKAKVGKKGQKYMHIPMQKDVHLKPEDMGTEKSQEYQRIIQHVMQKPKFGASKNKMQHDGSILQTQKLITDEPMLQGFYRFRKLQSAEQLHGNKSKGVPFQHVMFRTVSESPSKTGAEWNHPGINPAHILKSLEPELPDLFNSLLYGNLNEEIKFIFGG